MTAYATSADGERERAEHDSPGADHWLGVLQPYLTGRACLKVIGHVSSDLKHQEGTAKTVDFLQNAMKAAPKVGITDHDSAL